MGSFHVLIIEMPQESEGKTQISRKMVRYSSLGLHVVESTTTYQYIKVFLLIVVAMLVFGPVSDTVAIDVLLTGTGIVIALLCIPFMASKTRYVRREEVIRDWRCVSSIVILTNTLLPDTN